MRRSAASRPASLPAPASVSAPASRPPSSPPAPASDPAPASPPPPASRAPPASAPPPASTVGCPSSSPHPATSKSTTSRCKRIGAKLSHAARGAAVERSRKRRRILLASLFALGMLAICCVQLGRCAAARDRPALDVAVQPPRTEPEVPCPLPPRRTGGRWDFGRAFERTVALAGRAPRCTKIGELSVPTGDVRRLESRSTTVRLGRVPVGRYPVIRATTPDASFAVVVFRASDALDWDWVPRDPSVSPEARLRDTIVFDAASERVLHAGALPGPGVDRAGRFWVHP